MPFKFKKVLDELPMLGLGGGFAVAGASAAVIAVQNVRKSFYVSALVMGGGAWLAHAGSQVALGSIDRMRGLQ